MWRSSRYVMCVVGGCGWEDGLGGEEEKDDARLENLHAAKG